MPRMIRYQHEPATTIERDRAAAARILPFEADKPIRRVTAADAKSATLAPRRVSVLPIITSVNRKAYILDERVYQHFQTVKARQTTKAVAEALDIRQSSAASSCNRLAYHNLLTRVTSSDAHSASALWSL